jgi:hypothetical protein
VKITRGDENIGTYNKTPQSYRKWCKTCGGHLFTEHPGLGLALKMLLRRPHPGIAYNRHFDVEGSIVFHHASKLGCEGIVSKRLGSPYRSGRSADWIKAKNPAAPAVKREAEEDWSTLSSRRLACTRFG